MRFLMALSISVALLASSAAQEADSRIIKSMTSCLRDGAKTLDDRISDAASIALGVMSKCSQEIEALTSAAGQGTDLDTQSAVRRKMEPEILKMATMAVLSERARQRQ